MLIFDCNGVLADSEAIAATVASQESTRTGFKVSPDIVSRFFAGRRPTDMVADVEVATKRKLLKDFAENLADATMRRLRAERRATPHMEYALTWLRGPKCVCSSSPNNRVRMSWESTGLYRFFDPYVFSASDVPKGKPSPDLFLHAARKTGRNVIRLHRRGAFASRHLGRDSGRYEAVGFIGGSHTGPNLGAYLTSAGARVVIEDMRQLKSTVVALRGW